jgi:hypothetical protein
MEGFILLGFSGRPEVERNGRLVILFDLSMCRFKALDVIAQSF